MRRRSTRPPPDQSSAQNGAKQDEQQDEEQQDERQTAGGGTIRTAREAATAALREVLDLTSKEPESIVGVRRTKDGWSVRFEVVEDHRIPSSTDVLATYEATIDSDGQLVSFDRIRRYSRGAGDDGGSTR